MYRFFTLLAATLATASAQYGSPMGSQQNSQPMSGGSQQMNNKGSQQMSSGMQMSGGSQKMSSGMQMSSGQQMGGGMGQAWQGMQQSQNAPQVGIIIIATNNGGGSQWKQVSSSMDMYGQNKQPQTHQVTVGAPGLAYTPNSVQAAPGDYVQFNFMSENHTATQSSFDKPCVKMMGGMDSGFMPNMGNGTNPPPAMKVQVMNSMPTWYYCKQKQPKGHCGSGMTFSVNPTMQKSQSMFQQMAMQQNGTMTSSSSSSQSQASGSVAVATPQSSVAMGQGQNVNGQCQCQCLCGSNAYAPGLGVGMMGGLSGMMPMSPAPSGM